MGRPHNEKWKHFDGFVEWIAAEAPRLTNKEAVEIVRRRWGETITPNFLNRLRRDYGAQQTPETRARAFAQRDNRPAPATPEDIESRMLRDQVRRLSTRQTFYELVGQKIIEAVRALPALPLVTTQKLPPSRRLEEEEAVLLVSDVQAGLVVDAQESGGLGRYTPEILVQQLDYLGASVLRIMEYHQNIRRLRVCFLGDIVEGESVFPGQLREIEFGVIQQVVFCVERFAAFLHRMSQRFDRIDCYGVVGNHGRIGRKGEHSPMSNFDYLVYRWLEERLHHVKTVAWHIPETWWQMVDVQGWRFLLVHGDDVPSGSYGGIPLYGVIRHKFRWHELLRIVNRMTGGQVQDFDYLCLGHFSEAAQVLGILMNGSFPGGTEFSIKRLQLNAVPTQKLFAVHRHHAVTWVRDLHLVPLSPPK